MKKSNYQRPHTKVLTINPNELLQAITVSGDTPISGDDADSKFNNFGFEDDDNSSATDWED